MTTKRIVLLAGSGACLAAAVLCALLARDVGGWRAALRAGDVAAADSAPGAAPAWTAHAILPFGAARRLLAIDDDLAFRRAVVLFRRAHTQIPSFDLGPEGTNLRVEAEAALARIVRSDSDRRRASVAANLLGVLALVDATTNATGTGTPIERSIFELQEAIHLDPADEQAKANLELVYQLTSGASTLPGTTPAGGTFRGGASTSTPGHGY